MGRILERELREQFEGARYVGDIRGRGLFWAVEFVRDKESKESFDPRLEFGGKVQQRSVPLSLISASYKIKPSKWNHDSMIARVWTY